MYIVRNALRSIARFKGLSILTGIIIFVIALASCLALSIREAAKTAKKEALSDLEITASIQFDRQSVMGSMENREEMDQALGSMQELSLEELETYAQADSVKSFWGIPVAQIASITIIAVSLIFLALLNKRKGKI